MGEVEKGTSPGEFHSAIRKTSIKSITVKDNMTTIKKTILLTGAGFSKPFGGCLAYEGWACVLT